MKSNGQRHHGPPPDLLFVPSDGDGRCRTWARALRLQGWNAVVAAGDLERFDRTKPQVLVIHRPLDPRKLLVLIHFRRWSPATRIIMVEDTDVFRRPGTSEDVRESTVRAAKAADRIIVPTIELRALFARWSPDVMVADAGDDPADFLLFP